MKESLYEILIEKGKFIYGLENENENYFYKYLNVRTAIFLNKRKVNPDEMLNVLIDDLNISIFETAELGLNKKLIYNDEEYPLYELTKEVMDNLVFRAEMYGSLDIKEMKEEILKKGQAKSAKFRKSPHHKTYVMIHRLESLNEEFGVDTIYSPGVEGFKMNSEHNDMRRSLEETLWAEIKSFEHEETYNTLHITENQLEDYLVKDLNILEDGLVYMGRQVEIPGGVIDILARDSEGTICILELKIKEDKSILWQSIHYPSEMKKRHGKVRMMTIVPTYSKPIKDALDKMEYIERYSYEILVKNKTISDLLINKES